MGKTIVIANQKGGVGKTTTAINLSACVAAAEKRTLLIDNDPQANATSGVGVTANEKSTIYEILVGEKSVQDVIVETQMPYLSMVPSHINLVGAEIELVELENRERLLSKALESIRDKYDFIIIDCPPSLGLLTLNALSAADSVLIPVQCEYFALEGLGQLFNTINMVKKTLNPNLDIEGVLLTMYDSRLKLSHQIVDEVKRYFGAKVFKTIVSRNIRLSEAPSFGQPIILYDAISSGARHYMELAKEILASYNLLAAENLDNSGVSLAVVNMPWLNQFDAEWLKETVSTYPDMFVIEDHASVGGLGDRLTSEMRRLGLLEGRRLAIYGVEGFPACGTPEEVLNFHGLDGASLATRVRHALLHG